MKDFILKICITLMAFILGCSFIFTLNCNKDNFNKVATVKDANQDKNDINIKIVKRKGEGKSYEGAGIKYDRKVKHTRILTPFGSSPGETVGSQKAFEGENKSASIKSDSFSIGEGESSFMGGESSISILSRIWNRIKTFLYFGIGGFIILFILSFISGPIGKVASSLLRAILSVIPVVGSLVERIWAYFNFEKPLKETARGIENFKKKSNVGNDELKEELRKAQDESSKKKIKNIKKEL